MNIIEAVEIIETGKSHPKNRLGQRKNSSGAAGKWTVSDFCSGDLTPEMLVLLSGDYDVKEEKETKDVKETEEAV